MASLWTHFYSSFWLKLTVLFWPLFNDFFFFFFFFFGVFFFFFSSSCVWRASLGFWSCSDCPCGCFHSNTPLCPSPPFLLQTDTHKHTYPPPLPPPQFTPLAWACLHQPHVSLTDISVPQRTGSLGRNQISKTKKKVKIKPSFKLFIYFLNLFSSFFFSPLDHISQAQISEESNKNLLGFQVTLVHRPFTAHCC